MKVKEKPKYSIWQNVCFMVRTAWKTHKRVLLMCLAIAATQVALNLAQLYVTPEILAKVEQGASVKDLLVTIGMFSAALFLLMGTKTYLTENRLPAEVDVRTAVIRMITRKTCETSYPNTRDPKILKIQKQADAATSSNRDAAEHIWTTLTQILTNVAGFAVYLLLLSDMNAFLILVVIATSAIGFFVSRYINEWEYRHREEKEICDKELNYFLWKPRHLEFAKDVRIFGLAPWLRELQNKSMKMLTAFIVRREKAYIWANVVDVVMTLLRNGIAYAYLIWQTLEQGLPASEFLLYFTAVSGFSAWVTGILSDFTQLHKESIALSRIQEYLNIPEPFRFEDGIQPPISDGYELKLENVSFRYPGTQKNIFENINLTIHPGEKLAIVGLNGAGKTTLVKLLCGFYDPTEGRVLLNGQDIRNFNRKQYYALFSAVFQEFSILDTTIAQCVAQSVSDIDMAKVNECLEKAGLTDAVAKFPNGVQTHIGREVYLDGVMLSGGQTQRLMLARALYKDGPILVLDEPTAALDPIAENDIYMKYSEMTAGKTSVFISHRLASTRFCDRIIFIADGCIAEEGTHEELLVAGGAYANLFEVQSRYYREGGEEHEED
ncbi:MAG: ABC transporter ATP-binding protein [Faecousia sp.]